MKLIRVINAAFAASLIISAEATSQHDRALDAAVERFDGAAAASKEPITIRSGCWKSRTAVPSAVNSGFEA